MHELKEAQVERQFLLRDSPMRPQPGTQQGPEALGGIDMNLIEAISVLVAGLFASAMAHRVRVKAPILQWVIDLIFIGMDSRSGADEGVDERLEGGWLDILQHPDDHRAAPWDHPENRRLFLLQSSPTPRTFQSAPTPPAAFFFTASGNP